jgi:hypothetical protein
MVTLSMGGAKGPGAQVAGRNRQTGQRDQRGAGDFQQNRRRGWQHAADRDQHATCADVQGSREFQYFLALIVAATHKYWNGKGQPRPSTPLTSDSLCRHAGLFQPVLTLASQHPGGQIRQATGRPDGDTRKIRAVPTQKPASARRLTISRGLCMGSRRTWASRCGEHESATFCYTWVIPLHFPLTRK